MTRADTGINNETKPWYKQAWPWFLIAIPGVSVVAVSLKKWFAISSWDGLVIDDYYNEGKVIAQTMARSRLAQELGLAANLHVRVDSMSVTLHSSKEAVLPEVLVVTITHPTRAEPDQLLRLEGENGVYSGQLRPLDLGQWNILLEDETRLWRLNGSFSIPTKTKLTIYPYNS